MTAAVDVLPLFAWLSPFFPVGSYAYSHGLEAAVEAGDIANSLALQDWLADICMHGGVRNDAILLAAAYRATSSLDVALLRDLNDLALALAPSRERALEVRTQGDAFLAAVRAAWPCEAIEALARIDMDGVSYAVALGVAACGHGLDLSVTVAAFLQSFIANLVSAATRLGVIGQTDAQRVIAALTPQARALASECATATLDDLGGYALRADIASMRHELLYSRLFRS